MATCERQFGISGTIQADTQDTLSVDYAYTHDSDITDESQISDAYASALAASPHPLPRKRQRLGTTGLFVFDYSFKQESNKKNRIIFTVNYRKPEQLGAAMSAVADLHPVYHPVLNTVSYIEKEIVIEKAKNVEAITGGAARAENTLGYVQNGAGVVAQNPIVEVIRCPVIISRKNISSLGGVMAINRPFSEGGYLLTTNSDTVTIDGTPYPPRTLKFAGVDVGDQMEFDGQPYWEAVRMIEIHKTTDHIVDSVGTQYVNETGKMIPIYQYDDDGNITTNEITEPIPIKLDGTAGVPGTSVQITYRYLDEVAYAPLVG